MLIVFSGRTASGKSTIAKAAADALNGKTASFGSYIRYLAIAEDLDPDDRLTLQNLGQNLVEANPWAFTENFLNFAGYTADSVLVVDGLRHLAILQHLKDLIQPADKFVLIYVEIDDQERVARLTARGIPRTEIDKIEKHPSERDVLEGLTSAADLVIDGNTPIDRQTDIITASLDQQ